MTTSPEFSNFAFSVEKGKVSDGLLDSSYRLFDVLHPILKELSRWKVIAIWHSSMTGSISRPRSCWSPTVREKLMNQKDIYTEDRWSSALSNGIVVMTCISRRGHTGSLRCHLAMLLFLVSLCFLSVDDVSRLDYSFHTCDVTEQFHLFSLALSCSCSDVGAIPMFAWDVSVHHPWDFSWLRASRVGLRLYIVAG
jgi:hypothetical protein